MASLKTSLGTLFPAIRLSFAITLLTLCVLLTADMLGFTPNQDEYLIDARIKVSESLAIQFSILTPEDDIKSMQKLTRYIVKRNPDILSAGIRLASGKLIFKSFNHDQLWGDSNIEYSNTTHVVVPLLQNKKNWGRVELRFAELNSETVLGFFQKPILTLATFIMLIGFFVYLVFMLRTLRQLDPSTVIPERVNAAFDTLAEGVIIIDENEHILLTNQVFNDKVGRTALSLLGTKVTELNWQHISLGNTEPDYPWQDVIDEGKSSVSGQLKLKTNSGEFLKFALNVSAIEGPNDKIQGVLITLDDITQLEQRNTQLKSMIVRLEKSKELIQQQNKELHFLATRDPMTGCLNRRSFSEQFDQLFAKALEDKSELSCIMVDLDHFKLVNDNYGHATGDVVIIMLADILKSNTREMDLVGRYGGEEFCLVLPGQSTDEAYNVAERIRLRMKGECIDHFKEAGPNVTASLGIASIFDQPEDPSELTNLADQGLYVAKETGRNQVIRWTPEAQKTEPSSDDDNETSDSDEIDVSQLQLRIEELENIALQFSNELEQNKSYDKLTGLPNQALFYERMQQSIERGLREDQIVAVVIIDIELFSQINASMGRHMGDKLLQEVAIRLTHISRESDTGARISIARFSGDEFALLLTDLKQVEQVINTVERILKGINQAIEIDGKTIHLSSQMGVSVYPSDAKDADEMLNNAMTAKQYGKKFQIETKYQIYNPQMQDVSVKNLQLDKELRQAIEEQQWILLFQPIMDIELAKVVGAEALIRWDHPSRGIIPPNDFIHFAEQHALVIPIGDWVIQQACRQIKIWLDLGFHDCRLSINISSVQLMQPSIVSTILKALDDYQVPPRLLEIEITETTLMDNMHIAVESLKRLNARGIQISIDDFGTGYSSLSYLKNLPINNLKIDQSFITGIASNESDQQIVQNLITMAHSLDLNVIAEGVETKQQFDLLKQYNCDNIQGYLLGKPIPNKEFIDLLRAPENYHQELNELLKK